MNWDIYDRPRLRCLAFEAARMRLHGWLARSAALHPTDQWVLCRTLGARSADPHSRQAFDLACLVFIHTREGPRPIPEPALRWALDQDRRCRDADLASAYTTEPALRGRSRGEG